MTPASIAALFAAMVVLAAAPSVSVLTVLARSAASGFIHGVFTAMGIVIGDIVFILLAVFGLALLVEAFGSMFFLVRYIGGAYLIWLGVSLWRSGASPTDRPAVKSASLLSSFMAGLLVTLADQKAVFFYLGFFPAFLDLTELSFRDVGTVVVVTVIAVGGVKVGYAYAADRVRIPAGNSAAGKAINAAAAGVMVTAGVLVIALT